MPKIKQLSGEPQFYKGIQMMTTNGVHEEVAELVNRHAGHPGSKTQALDLAAGQGALSQRIFDLGFKNLTAWELETDKFKPEDITVKGVDLNLDFPKENKKYDLITAVEIIEHLENPFHFARQIKAYLKPSGLAVISTPNIESAYGRLEFLLTGRFRWFSDGAYQEWGHIQPLSSWQMQLILDRAGLEVVERSHNSQDAWVTTDAGLKNLIKGMVAAALKPFMKGSSDGDVTLWAVKLKS